MVRSKRQQTGNSRGRRAVSHCGRWNIVCWDLCRVTTRRNDESRRPDDAFAGSIREKNHLRKSEYSKIVHLVEHPLWLCSFVIAFFLYKLEFKKTCPYFRRDLTKWKEPPYMESCEVVFCKHNRGQLQRLPLPKNYKEGTSKCVIAGQY